MRLILLLATAVACLYVPPVLAETYRIVDLHPPNARSSEATRINERGQVAGWFVTAEGECHGFLWEEGKPHVDLGRIASGTHPCFGSTRKGAQWVIGLSESGYVVGEEHQSNGVRAFVWMRGRRLEITPDDASLDVHAGSINDRAEVVGWTNYLGISRSIYWTESTGMTPAVDRNLVPASFPNMTALHLMDDDGRIAGTWREFGSLGQGVFWWGGRGQKERLLETGDRTVPTAMNRKGQVVLSAISDKNVAAVWDSNGLLELQPLRSEEPGEGHSTGLDINEDGIVVGVSSCSEGSGWLARYECGVRWVDGRPERIVIAVPDRERDYVDVARVNGISDRGHIVGVLRRIGGDIFHTTYDARAVLLIPGASPVSTTEAPPVSIDPTPIRLGLTRLDPDVPITRAEPLQVIRIVAPIGALPPGTVAMPIRGVIRNERTKRSLEVTLSQEDRTRVVSGPILLAVDGADPNPAFPMLAGELPVCPGDEIVATVSTDRLALTTLATIGSPDTEMEPAPCGDPSPIPLLKLRATGVQNVVLDPRGDRMQPLEVRLTDGRDQPIRGEPILWVWEGWSEGLTSYTDEDGRARLEFAPGPRGSFRVVVDGMPVDTPLTDPRLIPGARDNAVHRVEATPALPVLAALTDRGAVAFSVDYEAPTVVEVFDAAGAVSNAIVDKKPFFVRVRLGRWDRRQHRDRTLGVTLTSSSGDKTTIETTIVDGVPGVFESRVATVAWKSVPVRLQPVIEVPYGGTVTFRALTGESVSRMYESEWHRVDDEAQRILEAIGASLALARGADLLPEEHELLQQKEQLVAQAKAWRKAPLSLHAHAVVGSVYVTFLLAPDLEATLGDPRSVAVTEYAERRRGPRGTHPLPFSMRESRLQFLYTGEAERVTAALAEARSEHFDDLRAAVSGVVDWITLENLGKILIAPFMGGYTFVTGYTPEGQVATVMEQLVGGLEAVVAVAAIPMTASRLTAIGRTAREVSARAALAEALPSVVRIEESFTAPAGRPLSRFATKAAVEESKAATAIRVRGAATRDALLQRVEAAELSISRWHAERVDIQRLLDKSKSRLPELRKEKRRRQRAGLSVENVNKSIAFENRNVASRKRRIAEKDRQIAKRQEICDEMNKKLASYARATLSPEELALMRADGRLPRARDRVNGLLAQDHYEGEVNRKLVVDEYEPGTGIRLTVNYQSPIPKWVTTDGHPPMTDVRVTGVGVKETRAPIMDHVNPKTLDVADSKYYTFAGKTEAQLKLDAARIADTVEKGRLVQAKLVRELRAKNALPIDDASVWQVVNTRTITIYTPVIVPGQVQDWIRLLVGRQAAKGVRFKVHPPDIDSWLAQR